MTLILNTSQDQQLTNETAVPKQKLQELKGQPCFSIF